MDHGDPTARGIHEILRNLREIAPTWDFNVPAGSDAFLAAMHEDPALAQTFYGRLRMPIHARAVMAMHAWDGLSDMSVRAAGARATR